MENKISMEMNRKIENKERQVDLEKVKELLEQAKLEERKIPSDALKLAKSALTIAHRHGFIKQQSEGYTRIGRCMWILGRFNDAVESLKKGLELAKPLKDGIYEAEALNALGNVHLFMEIYDQAISYYSKALEIAKNDRITELEAGLLNNIGELHKNLHDYDTALSYYKSSLEKYLSIRDDYGKVIPSFNIGDLHLQLKQYEQAEEVITNVLEDALENDGKIIVSYGYHLMGKLHQEKGEYEKSIGNFKKSIEVSNETSDQYHQANVLEDLATTYEHLGRYDLAEGCLQDALNIVKSLDGDSMISSIHSKLGSLYESMGNEQSAFRHYKEFYITAKETEAKRREEKLRSITFQLQLEESQKETKAYRYVIRELENRTEELSYMYRQMRIVGEIGQSITSTLKLETIFNRLYENVNHLMEAVCFGVGLYDSHENAIKYELYIEQGKEQNPFMVSLDSSYSWAAWCFNHKKEVMVNDVQKEYHKYIEGITRRGGELMNSIIFAPLIIEEIPIGVITVQSPKINAYNENQLDTVKTLASYIAIAVNNAQKSHALEGEVHKRREAQSELELANQKLQRLSEQDGLTGIPNRRSFDKNLDYVWNAAIRKRQPVSVLLMDVDHFKEYNDHYGHLAGDEVLKTLGQTIEGSLRRSTDLAARYGGDEFVALLPDTDENGAEEIANRIDSAVKEQRIPNEGIGDEGIVTLSVGWGTLYPSTKNKKNDLLKRADESLYEKKNNGKSSHHEGRQTTIR